MIKRKKDIEISFEAIKRMNTIGDVKKLVASTKRMVENKPKRRKK